MNFYENLFCHKDAYFTVDKDFETSLILRYAGTSMSITYFLRHYANHNPELVHYLQLHYPEYLL